MAFGQSSDLWLHVLILAGNRMERQAVSSKTSYCYNGCWLSRCWWRFGMLLLKFEVIEIMNIIWKSYMWIAKWRSIWRKIIAAMIFLQIILHPGVHIIIWFSYIHNFIIILSRDYNEPIQRPAPSWLVSLHVIGRALHQYRRDQGFESRTSLNLFQAFFLLLP